MSASHQASTSLPPPVPAVSGHWVSSERRASIPDPLTGQDFISYCDTTPAEAQAYVASLRAVPKTGLRW